MFCIWAAWGRRLQHAGNEDACPIGWRTDSAACVAADLTQWTDGRPTHCHANARAVGSSRGRIAGIAWVIDAGESWWAGHANEAPTLLRRDCLIVPPPLAPPQSPLLASGLGINRIHEHGEPEAPKDGEQATPARGRREEWGPASNTTAVHGPLPSPSANRRGPVKRAVGSRARRTIGTASMPGLLMLPCDSFSRQQG